MTDDISLPMTLSSHQRIGEWIGVSVAPWNAERFRRKGDAVNAGVLDFVAADETTHVVLDNKWIRRNICDQTAIDALHESAHVRRSLFGKAQGIAVFPFDAKTGELAGFTSFEAATLQTHAERGTRFPQFTILKHD